jgi:predicted DNA-binding transcriptional regulator YafY
MRPADRLFSIVQLLRGGRRVTARSLAEHLEVSERTIYRDVVELTLSGVPIYGEPGRGYQLPATFEIPPLMFDRREIEALVAGARMVEAWAGPALAESARSALAKIRGAVPRALAGHLDASRIFVPSYGARPAGAVFDHVHRALGENRRMVIRYAGPDGPASDRTIRPLGLYFWGRVWTLAAWCELRTDFRSFRLDRIESSTLGTEFVPAGATSLDAFLAQMRARSDAHQQPSALE